MARIFWATNIFIYFFEDDPRWAERLGDFRMSMLERQDELITSWLTVGEALTKPKETGNAVLQKSYMNFFDSGAVRLVPFDRVAAGLYSTIRGKARVSPPDAMQLACAAVAGTDLFVTNDIRLARVKVPGITFITSIDRLPY